MKIATYNIEWMNALFDDGKLDFSDEWSARWDVTKTQQLDAIADVLRMINADMIIIAEAPNEYEHGATTKALENFARHFGLRQSRARIGLPSDTDQEIAVLYDPNRIAIKYRPEIHENAPRFDHYIKMEIGDFDAEKYRFSKPPLELLVTDRATNFEFRVIGAHLKSKAPHGARDDEDVMRIGLQNRRKQIAQATWLRRRIDHTDAPLLMMGDFNDGPGCDELELLLGQSSVDIFCGDGHLWDPALATGMTTARFYNRNFETDGRSKFPEAQLDFIFVNPLIRPFAKKWEIWNPMHNARLMQIPKWHDALLTASDHFPVTLELDFDKHT